MDQSFYSSGSHTKGARGKESVGDSADGSEKNRRNKSDYCKRKDSCQKEQGCGNDEKSRGSLKDVDKKELKGVYFNARSIIGKKDELEAMVNELNPDIVGIVETWANDGIFDSELALQGFDMFRQDRQGSRHGGGVLLYVKSDLRPVKCESIGDFPEQVWCSIQDKNHVHYCIGVCYRTPNESIFECDLHAQLRSMLATLGSSKLHFILMGDMNYRFSSWPVGDNVQGLSEDARQFCEILDNCFLTQHVSYPTRNDVILDLIITEEPDTLHNVEVTDNFANSDHKTLEWSMDFGRFVRYDKRKNYLFAKADMVKIRYKLHNMKWSQLFAEKNVDECWRLFHEKLLSLLNDYVPVKCGRAKRSKPIWMSFKAQKAVLRRRKVYAKYKDRSHPAYIKANKVARNLLKESRQRFESKLGENVKADRKSFFAYARSQSKSTVRVGPLKNDQGIIISDDLDMSKLLNDYFISVFTAENDSRPFMEDRMRMADAMKLSDIVFTEADIIRRIALIPDDKAAGPDDLSPRFLKRIAKEISEPLVMIFRKSLDEGSVPLHWRSANVSPIFKKGNRQLPENYRPVSLTCVLCKVLESVIRDKMVMFLEENELIKDSQHGFRTGRSCATNLLVFLEYVTNCINNKENIDVAFLDFAKAFDKVPHRRLLDKLQAHGVVGKVHSWISAWLWDRRQRVCLLGHGSAWERVISGVPQGSVLGPVLFTIFINDLECCLVNNVLKFADDTKLFGKIGDDKDRKLFQNDLDLLCYWAEKWQMEFNVSKCNIMHIGKENAMYNYYMKGRQLDEIIMEKDLGVVISSNLKVNSQVEGVCAKANRMLGLIKRIIRFKDRRILLQLYKSLVRPHLEYATSVWSPYYKKDKERLEAIQHRFTRMLPGIKDMKYEDRLKELHLWSLEERRNRADLLEIFKMIKGFTAVPWTMFFQRQISCTRGHSWKLSKKTSSCNIRHSFFSQRAVNRWNALSQKAIDSTSVNSFKSELEQVRRYQMGFFMDNSTSPMAAKATYSMDLCHF